MNNMNCIPLVDSSIEAALVPEVERLVRLSVHDVVGSTNDVVREVINERTIHGSVALAEAQTLGRGRRGRRWHSPAGANLYCSIAWRFECSLSKLAGLSLAVGAILTEILSVRYGVETQLKWPNDIYYRGRKMGGVLVEVPGGFDSRPTAVIGVGLNVNMPKDIKLDINRPWTDLSAAVGRAVDRNKLAAHAINGLILGFQCFEMEGLAPWGAEWDRRDLLFGRSVTIDGNPPIVGTALGIDINGALLVEGESGVIAVSGGEASVADMGEGA